jgi:Tfp pilus assembly protein PilO
MGIRVGKLRWKQQLPEWLYEPLKLRALVAGLVLLVSYLAIYLPLDDHITDTARRLAQARHRTELTRDIQQLRGQVDAFRDRVPTDSDTNEWVQYVLGGVRSLPLKLLALDSAAPQAVAPYRAVVLRINLEGDYRDLDAFLNWIESNNRLFRIDAVKIAPARGESGDLEMQLTVLGMMS